MSQILLVLEAFQVAVMIKCCTLPRDGYFKTEDICNNININDDLNYWMDKNVLDQGIRLAKSYFLKFPICMLNEKYEGTAALVVVFVYVFNHSCVNIGLQPLPHVGESAK